MIKEIKIITGICMCSFIVACKTMSPPIYLIPEEDRTSVLSFSVVPPEGEYRELAARAVEGDSEACYELGGIYYIAFRDEKWALYFMRKSEKLGNMKARVWLESHRKTLYWPERISYWLSSVQIWFWSVELEEEKQK